MISFTLLPITHFSKNRHSPAASPIANTRLIGQRVGDEPLWLCGGNPETETDPSGQAFINDQEIGSLAEGAAYVGVPQAFQDAFSDGPILDPTVAPTVSA